MEKTKKTRNFGSVLTIIVLIAVGILLAWGWFGTSIKAGGEALEIKGLHGQEFFYSDMNSVNIRNELPTITAKTGGFNLAGKRLGNFNTIEFGRIKLYLYNSLQPFIYISEKDGDVVIVNLKEPAKTRELYKELTDKFLGDIITDNMDK